MEERTAKAVVDELMASGLTQADIAARSGVSQATISRIHKGESGGYASTERQIKKFYAERQASNTPSAAA